MLIITDPRPRCLDLCCKAGGASRGYQLAGFRVTGVDHEPQKHYIGDDFVQADMFAYAEKYGREYDLIHASPYCQGYSRLNRIKKIKSTTGRYAQTIAQVRALLQSLNIPYVIENVAGAPLETPITLCGASFGLKVYRHRFFELSHWVLVPYHPPHRDNTPPAGSGISDKGFVSITSGGIANLPDGISPAAYKNMAMGIDWMIQDELTEAIPPAYTRYLGERLREMGL